MNARRAVLVTFILVCFYLILPSAVYSCGPWYQSAIFSYDRSPDFRLKEFSAGELGVVHSGLDYSYLFTAYRYLSNQPLNEDERAALFRYWRGQIQWRWEEPEKLSSSSPRGRWLALRHTVSSKDVVVNPFRETEEYQSYKNCGDDSFRNATVTLQSRIKQFGADSRIARDWVDAQDTVFANCHSGKAVPEAAHPSDPAVIQADRAYQIAAAHLYSEDYNAAENEFHAIASDRSSPWRGIAHYLEARVVVRKASIRFDEEPQPKLETSELERAEVILKAILKDPTMKPWHLMSRERLGLVEARLHPKTRLLELSSLLCQPRKSALLDQEIPDLFYLLERNFNVTETDLTDWISTMKRLGVAGSKKRAAVHAFERWQQKKTMAWLVAAMEGDDGGANSETLLSTAEAVSADSPAYLSAALYRARTKPIDSTFQQILAAPLPTSTGNRFLHEKLLHSRTFEGFLESVGRKPADVVWEEENENFFPEKSKYSDFPEDFIATKKGGVQLFDVDSTRAFNRQLPLKHLIQAARTESLAPEIRRELTKAAWTKAFLLGNAAAIEEMSPVLLELLPQTQPYVSAYMKETDLQTKQFLLTNVILHFPGMTPLIHSGVGREPSYEKMERYGDNWWCGASKGEYRDLDASYAERAEIFDAHDYDEGRQKKEIKLPELLFLIAEDKRTAGAEWTALVKRETAPNLLARSVLVYQQYKPTDERIPEALDLSLRALRYGCSDQSFHDLSHKVFRVLHSKYPKSAAAKRNRPWG